MVEALFAHPESSVMFTLGIVALVLVSIFKEDFFRPSTLYFLVQMVMLGVSYLQFLPMMSDFNYSTWLVWGGGMFCFLVLRVLQVCFYLCMLMLFLLAIRCI